MVSFGLGGAKKSDDPSASRRDPLMHPMLSKIDITHCPKLLGMDSHIQKWRQTGREYEIAYDDPHGGIVRWLYLKGDSGPGLF